MTGQTITLRKILPASCEDVFDAWLDPEGMRAWMRPGTVTDCDVTLDPRVGGQFRIVMTAPNTQYVHTGEFRVLNRPSKIKFTWVSSRMSYQETLVTVELLQREAGCELILTHERFPREHSAEELEKGWNHILEKLGNYFV
jgi:uncharacterized protein YndB with AHSA1/START domain